MVGQNARIFANARLRLAGLVHWLWRTGGLPADRLAILALPLVLLASIAAILVLPPAISDRLTLRDAGRKAELWQRRAENVFGGIPELSSPEAITAAYDERLRAMIASSDISRLKIFDPGGSVIWSSRSDEVGSTTEKRYFFDDVAHGRAYAKLARKPRREIDNIGLYATADASEHVVAEIYRPFVAAGQFGGAIEFYSDVTDLHEMLAANLQLLVSAIAGAGLLLSAAGVFFLVRGNRRRMAEMTARVDLDAESMAQQVRLSREVQLLGELNEWLQSAASLSELFDMVSRFMTHLLPVSEGAIYVYSNSRDVLDGWSAWNGAVAHDHIRPDSCWGLRRGRTYTYGVNEVNFACEHAEPHGGRAYFCFPILAHGETVGLMHMRAAHGESALAFRESQKLAQMCAEQISMAIANVRMRDQLREQSIRDPLTGLFNRRHMNEVLHRLVKKGCAGGDTVSVLSIDVDHFKRFNDNHGHDAGDIVLRSVGEILNQSVTGDELACRPGGEEFAVILPAVSTDASMQRAEALRAGVEALKVHYGDKDLPTITISVGVAHARAQAQTVQDLVKAADDALYRAKAAGRNTVIGAGSAPRASAPKGADSRTPGSSARPSRGPAALVGPRVAKG